MLAASWGAAERRLPPYLGDGVSRDAAARKVAWDELIFILEESSQDSATGLSNPSPDRVWGHGRGVVMIAVDGLCLLFTSCTRRTCCYQLLRDANSRRLLSRRKTPSPPSPLSLSFSLPPSLLPLSLSRS